MMKFIVDKKIFDTLDNLYIGVVVAKDIDNSKEYKVIEEMLDNSLKIATDKYLDKKVKEEASIIPYRDAFLNVGINPNKFQCSVEAMFNRISKGKLIPHINPLVDLNNAISLKYTLPMGTHDLSLSDKDITLRYSVNGDKFIPMDTEVEEEVPAGEVVYAVENNIRTRRWTWRQSKEGKIDSNTSYVFFPIDGFKGFNDEEVNLAIKELKDVLTKEMGAKVVSGFIDKEHNEFEWHL